MNAIKSLLLTASAATLITTGLLAFGNLSVAAITGTALLWTLLLSVKAYTPHRQLRLPVSARLSAKQSLPLAA